MRKIISIALALCLMATVFIPSAAAAQFDEMTDVPNNWMHLPVSYVLEKGYMSGIGNRCFDPYGTLNRAQLAQILWNKEGSRSVTGFHNPFTDVGADWYHDAVLWCTAAGLVTGTSASTFAPAAQLTRQDVCVIFYRYYKDYLKKSVEPADNKKIAASFTDYAKTAGYAREALCWAYQGNLITAVSPNTIEPDSQVTRAGLAQILRNFDINILNRAPSGYPVNNTTVPLMNKGAVKLIAHRGGGGIATENTAQAFEKSGALSYFGMEGDVSRTKDNHYVVFHDNDLRRMAALGSRRIEECTLKELQEITLYETRLEERVGSKSTNLRIPTLQEYISICKKHQKTAVIDLKPELSVSDAHKIVDIIKAEGYLNHTIFISFKTDLLTAIRTLLPDQNIQLCVHHNFKMNANTLSTLKKYRFDLSAEHPAVSAELVQTCHENNIKVASWTVNDVETARKLISYGVDYITTDILE